MGLWVAACHTTGQQDPPALANPMVGGYCTDTVGVAYVCEAIGQVCTMPSGQSGLDSGVCACCVHAWVTLPSGQRPSEQATAPLPAAVVLALSNLPGCAHLPASPRCLATHCHTGCTAVRVRDAATVQLVLGTWWLHARRTNSSCVQMAPAA